MPNWKAPEMPDIEHTKIFRPYTAGETDIIKATTDNADSHQGRLLRILVRDAIDQDRYAHPIHPDRDSDYAQRQTAGGESAHAGWIAHFTEVYGVDAEAVAVQAKTLVQAAQAETST